MFAAISAAVAAGGTGYVLGDIITVVGGTLTATAQFKVTAVVAGVVTAVAIQTTGSYTIIPNNPATTSGGTGVGCVVEITWTQSGTPTQPPTFRTTQLLVQGIVQVETVGGVPYDVTPFIAMANQLTTANCTYPKPGQSPRQYLPYTDGFVGSQMELIERWLAGHFYTVFDNQLSAAKAGSVAVGYQFKIDLNLKSSMYGQTAMLSDTYGGLAELSNTLDKKRQIKVGVTYLGREISPLGWAIGDLSWNDSDVTTCQ